ncbi:TerC family protein, partial [Bacillus thuringiensis]|nr:TerC family protein [Bacillus thuringiensis]
LAYTSANMNLDEKWVAGFFESNPFITWAVIIMTIVGAVFFGKAKQKATARSV